MSVHTPVPGARFVDPTVLARVGNLELVARGVVDGVINGLHRSPYFGASVDFAEHRGYVAGDDIRRVDWKVFARTDRYFVKIARFLGFKQCLLHPIVIVHKNSVRFGFGRCCINCRAD